MADIHPIIIKKKFKVPNSIIKYMFTLKNIYNNIDINEHVIHLNDEKCAYLELNIINVVTMSKILSVDNDVSILKKPLFKDAAMI